MGDRLAIDVKHQDSLCVVRLSGVIDEDNDLTEVTHQIAASQVVVNTADIDRINSCGVRDWVTWLGELERRGADVYLVECSPVIMTQVNLVSNFVGNGTIVSFYAPYFCASCDTDKMLLVDVPEALESLPFRAPTCRCDQCDHTMEFDDIESSYFSFLAAVKAAPLLADVVAKLRGSLPDSGGKLRSRSSSAAFLPAPQTHVTPAPASLSGVGSNPSSLGGFDTSTGSTAGGGPQRAKDQAVATNRILYVIMGLLVVAITLLGYVVLRSL